MSQLLLRQPRWDVDSARRQLRLHDDAGTVLRFRAHHAVGVARDPERYLQQ